MEIYGNKLTLPDRVIEWSICKYEFIDQCKNGDVIIHDRLTTLDLAKLFNKALYGLNLENSKCMYQHLADIWLNNYCWLLDNFNPEAMNPNEANTFRHDYVGDIINSEDCRIFYDNIVVTWK